MTRYFTPFTTTLMSLRFLQQSLEQQMRFSAGIGRAMGFTTDRIEDTEEPMPLLFISTRSSSQACLTDHERARERHKSIRRLAFTLKN